MADTRKRGFDLEQRRRRVFRAWSLGTSRQQIADDEKLGVQQISRDLAATVGHLHGAKPRGDVEADALAMLGRIAHMESELLAAWERSKKPRQRSRAKVKRGKAEAAKGKRADPNESGAVTGAEQEEVTEGRDGNPRFIDTLKALWQLKAHIQGILKQTLEHTGPGGGPIPLRHEHVSPAEFTEAFRSFADAVFNDGVATVREDGSLQPLDPAAAEPKAGDVPAA
jgi:hypothetical protein